MTGRAWLVGGCLVLLAATEAMAQTPAPGPAKPRREREFSVGGVFAGPSSMGSVDAVLLGSNGTPSVTLFSTQNLIGPGFGAEMALGYQISRPLWFEATGGLLQLNMSTKISNDFEGAASETISSPGTRFSVEGALLWYVRNRGKAAWFVRGGGGFMREASGDLALAEDGFIGEAGVGYRYWWRTGGKGTFPRIGLRAEFRGVFRSGGISLGDRSSTFGPAGTVHFVFGY